MENLPNSFTYYEQISQQTNSTFEVRFWIRNNLIQNLKLPLGFRRNTRPFSFQFVISGLDIISSSFLSTFVRFKAVSVNELIPLLAKMNFTIDNHHHSILDEISEVS